MNPVKFRKLQQVRERLEWNLGLLGVELRLDTQIRHLRVNVEVCELLLEKFLSLCGNSTIEAAAFIARFDELKDRVKETQRPTVRQMSRNLARMVGLPAEPPKLEVVR